MSDRRPPMAFDELEARLADLARALAIPPTPDLASTVGSRLRAGEAAGRLPSPRPLRRSLPRSLLLAAAMALLLVGGVLAVRFGLELLSIELGPLPSATARAPTSTAPPDSQAQGPVGSTLDLGVLVTLDEAGAAASWGLLVPAALGTPDAAYVGDQTLRGQVALVYAPRDGLPASDLLDGAGLLVTQNRGAPDAGLARKLADTGQATVRRVDVNGAPGVWITGRPHFFWYKSPDGSIIQESRRLVGDTLAWERDGVLYRIEGDITVEEALELARSMG